MPSTSSSVALRSRASDCCDLPLGSSNGWKPRVYYSKKPLRITTGLLNYGVKSLQTLLRPVGPGIWLVTLFGALLRALSLVYCQRNPNILKGTEFVFALSQWAFLFTYAQNTKIEAIAPDAQNPPFSNLDQLLGLVRKRRARILLPFAGSYVTKYEYI